MSNLTFVDQFSNLDLDKVDKVDKVVLSIDVGILNLGISIGLIDDEFNLKEIMWVDLIDITKFTHDNELEGCKCSLNHTKSMADWMEHLFHEHLPIFQEADYILVERQPPQGLIAIEQLILYRWRDKCHIVSPRSMHKHYNINKCDYEERKQKTMFISTNLYRWHQRAIDKYAMFERKHDMTDSICIMGFWLYNQRILLSDKNKKERLKNIKLSMTGDMTVDNWFKQFNLNYDTNVYDR